MDKSLQGKYSTAVVNASPLIVLSKSSSFEILQLAGDRIIVPSAVFAEVSNSTEDSITSQLVKQTSWIEIVETPPIPDTVLSWDLGPGESAVIACAKSIPFSEAVIDDLAGRRCATAMGVRLRGTVGLVLLAKKLGEITSARAVLEELVRNGMYISSNLLDRSLRLVDE